MVEELNIAEEPAIVCGDFNFRPDSEEYKIFVEELGFEEALNGENITTISKKNTNLPWLPRESERADYVFHKNLLFDKLRAKIVFDEPFLFK